MTLAAPRGQDVPRRLGRLAVDAVGVGPGALRARPTPTTSCGRATSTRSPPRCSRPATAPAPRARRTTCSTASRRPTAASRRTRPSTARRSGRTSSSTRSPFPIVLAWQLGRRDAGTYAHVKAAVGCLARQRPAQPAGALGEPGRLLAGHDRRGDRRARHRRRHRKRQRRRRERRSVAGRPPTTGSRKVDGWTATTTGPLLVAAVLPAPDQGRQPERGHDVRPRRRRPEQVDQRTIVDPSFLELVRLGVKPASRRRAQHARRRRQRARRRHAERALLAPLQLRRLRREEGRLELGHRPAREPDRGRANNATIGRIWPIFAGERGEYELLAGDRARRAGASRSIAATAGPRPHDRRAGVGPVPALRLRGLPARRGHAVGHAARRGRTPSSCGSRGRSTPAGRSSSRRSWRGRYVGG